MRREAALNSVSIRKVDLPPPDTPVTAVKVPSGISAVTFFRLLPRAPTTLMRRPFFGLRRSAGTATLELAGEILAGDRVAGWP